MYNTNVEVLNTIVEGLAQENEQLALSLEESFNNINDLTLMLEAVMALPGVAINVGLNLSHDMFSDD